MQFSFGLNMVKVCFFRGHFIKQSLSSYLFKDKCTTSIALQQVNEDDGVEVQIYEIRLTRQTFVPD